MMPLLIPLTRKEPPQSARERAAEADRFYRDAPTGFLPMWLRHLIKRLRQAPEPRTEDAQSPGTCAPGAGPGQRAPQPSLKTREGCNSPAL